MTISSKILSTLQKTGQSIFNIQREVAELASEHARDVQKALSGGGSASQADVAFQDWKQSAHLAHDLQAINERLADVYAAATGTKRVSGKKYTQSKQRKPKVDLRPVTGSGEPRPLSGNNAKLMSFLEGLLNREAHIGLTQSQMHEGAAIPLGSVAYSIGRLVSLNLLEEGPIRGTYKLL